MLVELHVKNVALIDELEVCFEKGLNILTGETGAGKSVVIGSINLALGGRADTDLIRRGADYALVELVFVIEKQKHIDSIKALGLEVEDDGTIIIQRKIMPNRSVCKIGGETVSGRVLKEAANILIDMHGQHEHQSLLNKKKHLEILDEFSHEEIFRIKQALNEEYKKYRKLKDELEEFSKDEKAVTREMSLAEFEISEIESAALKIGEDEQIEELYLRMQNSQRILKVLGSVLEYSGGESRESAGFFIGMTIKELNGIADIDKKTGDFLEQSINIEDMLASLHRDILDYSEELEFSEEDFAECEERINTINVLKSKYGASIERIHAYLDEQKTALERMQNREEYRERANKDMCVALSKVKELCAEISAVRKKNAAVLSEKLKASLEDLNFSNVEFVVDIRTDENNIHSGGWDAAEFLISTNINEPPKSLSDVASGGELSRVMLAIKALLADKDDVETLVFDEVDTGISGKTAWKVSEKLSIIGREGQLICITHLPQIAAQATTHFVIEKESNDCGTFTKIRKLNDDESITELAKMLGGDLITDAVLLNARELKEMALNTKQY